MEKQEHLRNLRRSIEGEIVMIEATIGWNEKEIAEMDTKDKEGIAKKKLENEAYKDALKKKERFHAHVAELCPE